MSDLDATTPVRRQLQGRQADKVARLVGAALAEIRVNGYDGLTVRNVAAGAQVAPATAYTYFASKDHLVAEVFWRRLKTLAPGRFDRRRGPVARVGAVLADLGTLLTDEPELATAATTALLANDPDVRRLRAQIGDTMADRLGAALGDDADPAVLRVLTLAYSGALLQAGMGYLPYAEVAARVEEVAALIFGGRSR